MKLHEYLQIPGNQAKLAMALNKSTAQVWQWKSGLRPVPLELCMAIEAATEKEVTRQELAFSLLTMRRQPILHKNIFE